MGRVTDILARKGRDVFRIPAKASVYEAVTRMVEHGVGALMVMDEARIAGIFTERDHLRRVTLAERDPKKTAVQEVMTREVMVVEPSKSLDECMSIMTQKRIRHLPVVEDGSLAGMISIGDLVKHLSQEQAVEIRFLTEYITGRPPG